jgi:putative membrane protein
MSWSSNGMSGGDYALTVLGMIIFWVVVLAFVTSLLLHRRRAREYRGSRPASLTPDQLVAERFARGEIDQQEYSAWQAALREHQ